MNRILAVTSSLNGKPRLSLDVQGELANIPKYREDLQHIHARWHSIGDSAVLTTLETIQMNPTLWLPDGQRFSRSNLYVLDWEGEETDEFYQNLLKRYKDVTVVSSSVVLASADAVDIYSAVKYLALDPDGDFEVDISSEEEDNEDLDIGSIPYKHLLELVEKSSGCKTLVIESQSEYFNSQLLYFQGESFIDIQQVFVPVMVFDSEVADIFARPDCSEPDVSFDVLQLDAYIEDFEATVEGELLLWKLPCRLVPADSDERD